MSRGGGAGHVSSTRGGSVVSDELISRGRGRGREDSCGGELGGRFEPAPYTRRGGLRHGGGIRQDPRSGNHQLQRGELAGTIWVMMGAEW